MWCVVFNVHVHAHVVSANPWTRGDLAGVQTESVHMNNA